MVAWPPSLATTASHCSSVSCRRTTRSATGARWRLAHGKRNELKVRKGPGRAGCSPGALERD
eukprot:15264150-Alexandrium_andersonii.AAC.1